MITVIPAMDLMDGHCVRLREGDFEKRTNYSNDPAAIARLFEEAGFVRLHMVDLDGAKSGSPRHLQVLESVCRSTGLIIDYSGGIKTDNDILRVFDAGANMAAIGSVAVTQKDIFQKWLRQYGPDRILTGLDIRNEKLAVKGWTEQTEIGLMEHLSVLVGEGLTQIFCTDISKDGLLSGPSTKLYQEILQTFPDLHLIASGGVRSPFDIEELDKIGCSGAIVGKAIYENLDELNQWIC